MSVTIAAFIEEYSRAITEGYAAVFAGAGLSKPSGYINWKELLRPLAEAIGLDVDKEHDLLSVAQYYCNQQGTRSAVNQRILNEFTKETSFNDNISILTRLSISTYWTTNYDELIEEGLKSNNRKPDIKVSQESLANNIYDRDAVVYKMHGDVRDPSKTVLFVGFSFEDPNLNYILGRIRVLLGASVRNHYCFLEKVRDHGHEE